MAVRNGAAARAATDAPGRSVVAVAVRRTRTTVACVDALFGSSFRRRLTGLLRAPLLLVAVLGVALLAACSPVRVAIDADTEAPFATYRNYAWLGVPPPPTGNPVVDDNSLLEARIQTAVDRELQGRGYQVVPIEQAHFSVHYHAILDKKTAVVTKRDYEV